MANKEHLAILKKGVDAWNKWREENPGIVPDISRVYLFGKDVSRADFRQTCLSEADLRQADLSGAKLIGADLHQANLNGASLKGADISNADLRGADLGWAHLCGARLNGANLSGANLNVATLLEANLAGTKLIKANLSRANLYEANLSGANLTGCGLGGANLTGANLSETDLSETRLYDTVFARTSLKETKGLDKCRYLGQSIIDHRTLQRSGPLPKEFLRACGLTDSLSEAILTALEESKYYSAFISYSRYDRDFALKLEGELKAKGVLCWLDEHKMLPGDDKYEEIDRGIYGWDKFLLCCSRRSLTSWWVDSEVNKVFTKEQQLTKERGGKVKCLIPLDLDGYILTAECRNAKKDEILSRIAADFTGWSKDEKKFEKELKQGLKALLLDNKGREKLPEPKI